MFDGLSSILLAYNGCEPGGDYRFLSIESGGVCVGDSGKNVESEVDYSIMIFLFSSMLL